MASAITTTASTLEGQLWEVALHIQIGELTATSNPNNIQTTLDTENRLVAITFSAPATFSVSTTGALVASPTPYLT